MNIAKYCQLISSIVSQGSRGWSAPRSSDWIVTGTGGVAVGGSIPFGVGEIGLAAGSTEIALYHRNANLPVILQGWGGGATANVGFSLPVGITYGGGELGTEGFSLFGIENLSLGKGVSLPSGGIGSMLAGPKANNIVISPHDLVTSSAEKNGTPTLTIISGAAGTGMQYSIGVAFFADRPVIDVVDLAYTKAIALVYGMQLEVGTAISAGVSAMWYNLKIRDSSLPCPGARFGMSIPKARS
ncbi:MAG: hypothetical protein GQ532_05745 [Methylomarinum sp.]|nr:hypothetical protein [Methylomarinum sp.]